MEDLQPIIDKFVNAQFGIEAFTDEDHSLGALADIAYNPDNKHIAFVTLGSPEELAASRIVMFKLRSFKADKEALTFRSTGKITYRLTALQTLLATSDFASYSLSDENKDKLRKDLISSLSAI